MNFYYTNRKDCPKISTYTYLFRTMNRYAAGRS